MHSFIASSHMRLPPHQDGVFIPVSTSSSRTRPICWGRAAHPLTNVKSTGLLPREPKRTNQRVCLGGGCGVLFLLLRTTRQDQNPTCICLLGTCSTQSCQSHILHCLSENPLCSADGGPGRKRKPHLPHRPSFLELGRAWKLLEGSLDRPPHSAETLAMARLVGQEALQLALSRATGSDKSGEKQICHLPDLF